MTVTLADVISDWLTNLQTSVPELRRWTVAGSQMRRLIGSGIKFSDHQFYAPLSIKDDRIVQRYPSLTGCKAELMASDPNFFDKLRGLISTIEDDYKTVYNP